MNRDFKLERTDQNTLRLQGTVNFTTAGTLFESIRKDLVSGINSIDCNGIQEADSAAISLLLVCLRQADRRDFEVRIDGLGEQLLSFAKLYGVEKLLTK